MYKEIDFKLVNEWFYVDAKSGSGLRWKKDCPMQIRKHQNFRKAGDVAGTHSNKYWRVGIKGNSYITSRVVYCLIHGSIPSNLKIDHIDGNVSDNSINNLRLVNTKVNGRNRKLNSNNSTGVPQIARMTTTTKHGEINEHFSVAITTDHRVIQKKFNITRLGEDLAFQLALEYRKSMLPVLLENNYSERHINGT